MIVESVGFKVAPGNRSQAREWGAKMMEYSKKLPGQHLLLQPITGDNMEMVLVVRCASLSEYEEARNKRMSDPEWAPITKEGQESDWYLGHRRNLYEALIE